MAGLSGGDKLKAALAELARRIDRAGTLRVGFLEGATYEDGTPVAMIAAIQNFGAPAQGIPPRPFFSNMIREKSPRWAEQLAELLKRNHNDVDVALEQMGAGIKGQLQQSIVDTNAPPLKPATIRRKGFAKPLIETSNMINSVDYEVSGTE